MTDLSYPMWIMRDDAKNIRASAENVADTDIKKMILGRAAQCELAEKILELYGKHSQDAR